LTVAVREPIKIALLAALAFAVNWQLAAVFFIAVILGWLVGGQIRSLSESASVRAAHQGAHQLVLLQESLMLVRLVKCYVMEAFTQGRVERQLAGYARSELRRDGSAAFWRAVLAFLAVASIAGFLLVLALLILGGQLSVAGLILLVAVLASLYAPVRHWLEQRRLMEHGQDSAIALFKFLDRPGEVSQVVGAEQLPPLSRGIEFDSVTLREPGGSRTLLHEVSLTIPAGQQVGLVGPDDREKHALVYLVLRFLDPSSGEIRADDHNLREVKLESLRKQTGVVLQHNLVFNDTVVNNITGGDGTFKLLQVMEAAKLAHAHQFIQKLPKGYDTPIGDLGQSLGVGEQFRIALARAILRKPALLIIEEPAAFYLDLDTRDLLDDTYARVLPGRTVLFLPHREATLQGCVRIFLLHNGRLEAQGEHLELMKHSALYRHLFYMEFNEFSGL
jgi:ABC-type multidrug transport system fused ATPase/permease subunit